MERHRRAAWTRYSTARPTAKNPETGFVLLVFPFWDHWGRCNYISNADPADILTMLRGQVKRLEERTGKDHD